MDDDLERLCNAVYCMAGIIIFWAMYLILDDMYVAGLSE
jgi:hypothetical protein